jgi:hypothetical protein
MTPDRNEIVYRNGIGLDRQTAALWDLLVAKFPGLILTQGVRSGAAASGGTHLGLGVLDLYLGRHAGQWQAVLAYAFEIGFFGWYRPAIAGVWKTHIHLGVRGNGKMAASLKTQEISWRNGRNGLRGNGDDFYNFRPKNARTPAPWPVKPAVKPKPAKPAKPPRPIFPWFNVAFVNTQGNHLTEYRTIDARLPRIVKDIVGGSPAIIGFAEVRPEHQINLLTKLMRARGYSKTVYDEGNMTAVFHRSHVEILGTSFSKFSVQDGGNTEGVLRVKFRVNGSRAQAGFVHLDVDASPTKKRANIKQTVAALERYAGDALKPDWKSRTVIAGDFNAHKALVDGVLRKLGFKDMGAGAPIDFMYVGAARASRGASKMKSKTDHYIIRGRLGRYTK